MIDCSGNDSHCYACINIDSSVVKDSFICDEGIKQMLIQDQSDKRVGPMYIKEIDSDKNTFSISNLYQVYFWMCFRVVRWSIVKSLVFSHLNIEGLVFTSLSRFKLIKQF